MGSGGNMTIASALYIQGDRHGVLDCLGGLSAVKKKGPLQPPPDIATCPNGSASESHATEKQGVNWAWCFPSKFAQGRHRAGCRALIGSPRHVVVAGLFTRIVGAARRVAAVDQAVRTSQGQ